MTAFSANGLLSARHRAVSATSRSNSAGGDPQVAINEGYEVQIDDEGAPDGAAVHKTGAIYTFQGPTQVSSKPAGEWDTFNIRVERQIYNVTLNREPVIRTFNGTRGLRGYIGLQNHSPEDRVLFRNLTASHL